MTPAERIRDLIDNDPRSLAELARVAGMSPAHFNQIKSGHRPDMMLSTVARILTALDRNWSDLDEPEK